MEHLWEKEDYDDELYVDLFAADEEEELPYQPKESTEEDLSDLSQQKNNQRSIELRNTGNDYFLSGNVFDALQSYNQSLCFAENGSEHIPLAYVNRSICFFRLKMYNKALNDIKLAKDSNLPERMHSKVQRLAADCQKIVNVMKQRESHLPKLSYEADMNYACMANVLKIEQNDAFGRHMIAKCDIPVGKIVLLEECYLASAKSGHDKCYTCFRQMGNFIPCPNCADVLFCGKECLEQNSMHKWDCSTILSASHIKTKLIINAIMVAVETFSGVDKLMNFVENILSSPNFELPECISNAESKFHFYFKLTKSSMFFDQLFFDVYITYRSILTEYSIASLFDSEDKKRFLMHLTAHIYFINHSNSIGSDNIRRVTNVFSIINHSCAPNLYTRYEGKMHHCITIRPVKEGEQLFINYLGTQNQTFHERQAELKSKWNFVCKCDKCEPLSPASAEHEQMLADYTFVTENCTETTEPAIVLEVCQNFFSKYSHSVWSKEIEAVSEIYKSALVLEDLKKMF